MKWLLRWILLIYTAANAMQYVLFISHWSLDGTSILFHVTHLITVQNISVVQDLIISDVCAWLYSIFFNFYQLIYGLTGFSYVLKRHVRIDKNNITTISNVIFTYVAT